MSDGQESGVEGPESGQGPAAVNPNTDLFDLLRSLDLPTGDYAVFGSGPLIVRGVIEPTNDLDVVSRGAAWAAAVKLGQLVDLPEHGVTVATLFDGAITVGTEWAIGDFDVDELIDTAETIDGIPFVRLEHVVAYKQIARRDKDVEHLELLAEYEAWRHHIG
jgi:hypothetical protein